MFSLNLLKIFSTSIIASSTTMPSTRIKVNNESKLIKREVSGYESRTIQHEIDHLDGKLFIDYLSSLKRNMIIKRVQKLKKIGEV